jgi:hypothetical protein
MTPEEIRQDGIRSYELAIKEARKASLKPSIPKLHAAIKTLRDCGFTVRLAEGEGIAALWNCGPLPKLGYYEVLRLARKATIPAAENKLAQSTAFPLCSHDAVLHSGVEYIP